MSKNKVKIFNHRAIVKEIATHFIFRQLNLFEEFKLKSWS